MSGAESHWIIANMNLVGQIITLATIGGLFCIALLYYYLVENNIFAKQLVYVFITLFFALLVDIIALVDLLEDRNQDYQKYYLILTYYSDLIALYVIHHASMRIWRHNHTKILTGLGILGLLIAIQLALFPGTTQLLSVYAVLCLSIAQYYHIIDRAKLRRTAFWVITGLFTAITLYYIYIYAQLPNTHLGHFKQEWLFILIFIYTLLVYLLINYRHLLNRKDVLNNQLIRDSLTGLFAKTYFNDYVKTIDDGWILFIDVNNFKWINDTLGHNYGDDALRNFGAYLKLLESERLISARYGGDEFAVVLDKVAYKETFYLAKTMCQQFRQTTDQVLHSYNQDNHTLMSEPTDVGISIGIAKIVNNDYGSALLAADERMYTAKSKGNYIIQNENSHEVIL